MIDLHTHILWGMDDGAESPAEALHLCKTACKNGISALALTPHMTDLRQIDTFLEIRGQKLQALQNEIQKNALPLRVYAGAEVFLDRRLFSADDISALTLHNSRYLLCEYSLHPFDPDYAFLFADAVLDRGLVPIIAHPERYPTFRDYPSVISELYAHGARFQVNTASLTGLLGTEIEEFAEMLLTDGYADFLATDAHNCQHRRNDFALQRQMFPPSVHNDLLQFITETAPLCVLENKPLPQNPFWKNIAY